MVETANQGMVIGVVQIPIVVIQTLPGEMNVIDATKVNRKVQEMTAMVGLVKEEGVVVIVIVVVVHLVVVLEVAIGQAVVGAVLIEEIVVRLEVVLEEEVAVEEVEGKKLVLFGWRKGNNFGLFVGIVVMVVTVLGRIKCTNIFNLHCFSF